MTVELMGTTFSASRCKFCGKRIMWKDRTRYTDFDGRWRNRKTPRNLDGQEHHCESRLSWNPVELETVFVGA